jgi:hypothetical protein
MEGHGVGGKNSNRVIKASDDDDVINAIIFVFGGRLCYFSM